MSSELEPILSRSASGYSSMVSTTAMYWAAVNVSKLPQSVVRAEGSNMCDSSTHYNCFIACLHEPLNP